MQTILVATTGDFQNNRMFELSDPKFNRDNCLEPNYRLKVAFGELGYDLKTMDLGNPETAEYILFYDIVHIENFFSYCRSKGFDSKMVLFLWEPPTVSPDSYDKEYHNHFKTIFTWDDDLVDGQKYLKMYIPQPEYKKQLPKVSFEEKKLIVSISSNKSSRHPNQLYDERARAIEFFSKHYHDDFRFYGMGWARNLTPLDKLKEFIFPSYYNNYGGPVSDKVETMSKYKFSICYENIKGLRGYVTEKIFDSFKAGCVPVYLGAENITDYIPFDCFIDRRDFAGYDELDRFLKSIDKDEHLKYQNNIRAFLRSERYSMFSSENFVNTIIEGIHLG